MEKQAFEPTGLIPRSIIRTVDRFVQQLLPGREKIALQEYRVSRYQILVSIKSLLTLFLIPILVSSTMKALLFTPLVEHFWNKNQSEIFLNQYQEKRAFSEMHDFSEKMFFESLLIDNKNKSKPFESENFDLKSITNLKSDVLNTKSRADTYKTNRICLQCGGYKAPLWFASQTLAERGKPSTMVYEVNSRVPCFTSLCESLRSKPKPKALYAVLYKAEGFVVPHSVRQSGAVRCIPEGDANRRGCKPKGMQTEGAVSPKAISRTSEANRRGCIAEGDISHERGKPKVLYRYAISRSARQTEGAVSLCDISHSEASVARHARQAEGAVSLCDISRAIPRCKRGKRSEACEASVAKVCFANQHVRDEREKLPKEIIKFVTDVENEKYQILFQKKSLELAKSYNKQSILAITNLLGDFFTFFTLFVLFRIMRPELIILKSFLTESVYSLSDTTKSFLLILGMDLLVGFHSPRGWELLLEGFLRHIGLPENENFILLFVALFPVFLDTVFKYWIFRYLNKISPSTVVTYHSMIE